MPSNTAGIAETRRELCADVVETIPPWKKNSIGSKHVFDELFFGGGHYCPDSSGWYPVVAKNSQRNRPKTAFSWPQT